MTCTSSGQFASRAMLEESVPFLPPFPFRPTFLLCVIVRNRAYAHYTHPDHIMTTAYLTV